MSNSQIDPAATAPDGVGSRIFWAGAVLAFLLPLIVYVKTMAASASFWDAGEFIATAYTLGIPHSPGTPLYVLVGRVFTLLPIWFLSIAERVNLLSAVCGAAGILFVYMVTVRLLDAALGKSRNVAGTMVKVAGALVGALFLTFSDTYWNNAVEAEVYAMSNALMGFMTWLALKWSDKPRDIRSTFLIYLLFYLLALSVGFHLGTILAFSGVFVFILMTREKTFSNLEFVIACLGIGIFVADATLYRDGQFTLILLALFLVTLAIMWGRRSPFPVITSALVLLGLSVHLFLVIRSGHNPNIDEGNPENWRNLYSFLRREQYPSLSPFTRKASWGFQIIDHFGRYFQEQFAMFHAKVGAALIPIALGIWGMVDQFTRHKKTFIMLFVTLITMSAGLIFILNFSDSEVRERDYFYSPAFYYFAVYIGLGAASLLHELRSWIGGGADRRMLSPALIGVTVVMLALPFFTMKHYYFSHDRSNNYTCPVYARNMLKALEKDAIIFTNGDNDTFPLWYIQEVEGFRTDVRVVNLSLLNTPWYIEQIRDNEPQVPITWSDEQVHSLRPRPTSDGWLLVRDLAVNHILQTNRFRRPVYFAVTIPPATYEPYRTYLEMEGLVYKVVPRQGENMINITRLEENIYDNYKYDGILTENWERDTSIYLPPHTIHLVKNYAAAFIQLGYVQHQDSTFDKALRSMKIAYEISPTMEPPRQLLGLYYLDAGDTASAIEFYTRALEKRPDDRQLMYRFAGVYERLGRAGQACDLLDTILLDDPENRDLFMTAHMVARNGGLVDRARRYAESWLRRHPQDAEMRGLLESLERPSGTGSP